MYACAFFGLIFFGVIADRTNQRGLTLVAANCVSLLGYALLIGVTNNKARFAATCILSFGLYSTIILQLSWMTMATAGYTNRGASLAFNNIFSQLFAMAGNQAYLDPPYYRTGNTAALGMIAGAIIMSLTLRWYYSFLNERKRRDAGNLENVELRMKSFDELGTKHPDFFYTT